jgi:cell division protein FtsZ
MNETTNPDGALKKSIAIRVIGVGGAGGNAVAHMCREKFQGVSFKAINTDAQALEQCGTPDKLVLGCKLTRGLGTGGDPAMGRAAAEEDLETIRAACQGADIVFIAAGLGGGTGTGASPIVARVAQECGALVLGIVTLPFEFEGARRQRQAQMGLLELKAAADAVICLPNQKILKLVDDNTGMLETFKISNDLLAQGVRGVWRLLTQTGLINVDFADLCAVTRGRHAESSFATVEASGENRATQIVERLLSHPLLEEGQILSEADSVLISVLAGPDLTIAEVNRIMEQINRHCENAHLIMGAAIEQSFSERLAVTLIASCGAQTEAAPAAEGGARMPLPDGPRDNAPGNDAEIETPFLRPRRSERPPSRFLPPPPALSEEQLQQARRNRSRSQINLRQGQLPLEIVSRGRFEKSEPTIHRGEDLDVPTYIRRGVPLN